MLLYVPNREIVTSKVLYFWQVCRCIYCSKIPNVKPGSASVYGWEMKNMNVLKEAAPQETLNSTSTELIPEHYK